MYVRAHSAMRTGKKISCSGRAGDKGPVNIGLIGLGTVGAGVANILLKKKKVLEQKLGFPVVLYRAADIVKRRENSLRLPARSFTTDSSSVITDPRVDIVVELIGGLDPAREYILNALRSGKHVVTANKLLLATHGAEIFRTASRMGREVGFEAAVAGGIPIIKVLRESLLCNRILSLYGIINGTANYILSKMTEQGVDFSAALKDAQRLGFAEADPTLDIEGIDSAHKLSILAFLAFGVPFSLRKIYTEGIRNITPLDIEYAGEFGYTIKLLAIAKQNNGEVELRVHPAMLPKDHLISSVSGEFNAVYVKGDSVGPSLFYGKGAGEKPTGSAVVSDITDIARQIMRSSAVSVSPPPESPGGSGLSIKRMEDVRNSYYIRISVRDKPGVLSRISGILGERNISIKSVIQKGRKKEKAVPLVMMTHDAREKDMVMAARSISRLTVVSGKTHYIRVEDKEE